MRIWGPHLDEIVECDDKARRKAMANNAMMLSYNVVKARLIICSILCIFFSAISAYMLVGWVGITLVGAVTFGVDVIRDGMD